MLFITRKGSRGRHAGVRTPVLPLAGSDPPMAQSKPQLLPLPGEGDLNTYPEGLLKGTNEIIRGLMSVFRKQILAQIISFLDRWKIK